MRLRTQLATLVQLNGILRFSYIGEIEKSVSHFGPIFNFKFPSVLNLKNCSCILHRGKRVSSLAGMSVDGVITLES